MKLILPFFLLSTLSFAKHGPCQNVNLTDDQRSEIREIRQQSRPEMRRLRREMRRLRRDLRTSLQDETTTEAVGLEKMNTLADKRSERGALRRANRAKILFTVLESEQRVPWIRCQRQRRNNRN